MSRRPALEQVEIDHTVARLCTEFDHLVPRNLVQTTVRRCIADLAGAPTGAIPELSERLARQRLLEVAHPHLAGRMLEIVCR